MLSNDDVARSFDDGAVIERARDLTAAHIESELVIMHIGSGTMFQLNPVATRIWDALDTLDAPVTVGALYARIQEQFEVSNETCRADVGALIGELASQGVVRVTSPG